MTRMQDIAEVAARRAVSRRVQIVADAVTRAFPGREIGQGNDEIVCTGRGLRAALPLAPEYRAALGERP